MIQNNKLHKNVITWKIKAVTFDSTKNTLKGIANSKLEIYTRNFMCSRNNSLASKLHVNQLQIIQNNKLQNAVIFWKIYSCDL